MQHYAHFPTQCGPHAQKCWQRLFCKRSKGPLDIILSSFKRNCCTSFNLFDVDCSTETWHFYHQYCFFLGVRKCCVSLLDNAPN